VSKTPLAAVSAACIAGLLAATTGLAHQARTERFVTARVGDSITIPSIDLFCTVLRRDPDRREAGPLMTCSRNSVRNARAVSMSRFHYDISRRNGTGVVFRIERAP
jgi:hypothetical protein